MRAANQPGRSNQALATVDLGTAGTFAILAGTGITNTGTTTIIGDVGSSPTSSEIGFGSCPAAGCVNLTGTNHTATDPNGSVTQVAKAYLTAAYLDAAGRTPTTTSPDGLLAGNTLVAGVYNSGGFTFNLASGTLTLNGQNDPSSVWIFQATSDLITASSTGMVFINGGDACNVSGRSPARRRSARAHPSWGPSSP